MKPAVIIAVALAFSVYFAQRGEGQNAPGKGADETTKKTDQPSPLTITNQINSQRINTEARTAQNQPPHWYESPEWVLVIVGCITFAVIGWQSVETRRAANANYLAAEATQRSVEALVNSERAWVLVDIAPIRDFPAYPNRLEILWVFPSINNHGRTPARLTRVELTTRLMLEGEALPPTPDYTGPGFDERVDLVLPQGVPVRPKTGISAQDFVLVRERNQRLYNYGFIEYLDLGKTQRRSAYCFIFVIQGGFSPHPTGFYPALDAPAAYTQCT